MLESLGHIGTHFRSRSPASRSTADGIVNDEVLPEPTKASGLSAFIGKLQLKTFGVKRQWHLFPGPGWCRVETQAIETISDIEVVSAKNDNG